MIQKLLNIFHLELLRNAAFIFTVPFIVDGACCEIWEVHWTSMDFRTQVKCSQVPLMKGHLHISYFVQPAVEKPILHTNNHISEAENLLTDQLLALFISPLQHTHIYSPL